MYEDTDTPNYSQTVVYKQHPRPRNIYQWVIRRYLGISRADLVMSLNLELM